MAPETYSTPGTPSSVLDEASGLSAPVLPKSTSSLGTRGGWVRVGCRSGTSWGQHLGPRPSLPSEKPRPHFRKQPWPKGLWDSPGWGPATCPGLTAQAFLGP